MKKFSIFVIPVVIILLLLAGVFVWKMIRPAAPVATREPLPLPNSLENAGGTKPTNPFSFLFGQQAAPIPTPTPASVSAMNADLATVGDDGGAADFSSLQKDASGL